MHTHSRFSQSYFVLDYFHHVLSRGRRMELDGVVLSVHEMKPSVYQPPVDCAQYFLSGRRPLSPSGTLSLGHALRMERNTKSIRKNRHE